MKRIAIIICLLSLTSACALDPRYVESDAPNAATVRIVAYAVMPILYENGGNCSAHRRWPEGKVRVAPDGSLDPQSTLLRLTPGKELALNLQRTLSVNKVHAWGSDTVTITSCDTMVSFVPLERRHYGIAFETDGEKCYVGLLEAPSAESLEFRPATGTELRFREKLTSAGPGGTMCN